MKTEKEIIAQIFRNEFSKMVALMSKLFGLQYIEIAEDIVSQTFLIATETWDKKGIPENPTGWLYTVAKHEAHRYFKRNKVLREKIIPELKITQVEKTEVIDLNFSTENIKDSQLQMMFAICNPVIVNEAQIGLALRILCGFGIDEIAESFFTNKETINKRLFRAKEKLRSEKINLEMPQDNEIKDRLDTVLHIIYLLFNEGYYSVTQNQVLRKELCLEALRLGIMLIEYDKTNLPKTNALIALMCFHSSRFAARQGPDNFQILYEQQNKDLWDKNLINQGNYFLNNSAQGAEVSSYHLEARIAYIHCLQDGETEKWEKILQLYNQLLQVNYSPSVALNRTYALYKVSGAKIALVEAEKLKLENNHFYFTLLGELYKKTDSQKARINFLKAHDLAKSQSDKETLLKKINAL
jgi:predicted RNA polymerase sigma factor